MSLEKRLRAMRHRAEIVRDWGPVTQWAEPRFFSPDVVGHPEQLALDAIYLLDLLETLKREWEVDRHRARGQVATFDSSEDLLEHLDRLTRAGSEL